MTVFDYLLVGGGSSGAVVASRLSERASGSVLLVEADRRPSVMPPPHLTVAMIAELFAQRLVIGDARRVAKVEGSG